MHVAQRELDGGVSITPHASKFNNMTNEEFNTKWGNHQEKGHYGMDLGNSELITYVDKRFTELLEISPTFTYSQIKEKFGTARVYMDDIALAARTFIVATDIENGLNKLMREIRNRKAHGNK